MSYCMLQRPRMQEVHVRVMANAGHSSRECLLACTVDGAAPADEPQCSVINLNVNIRS